MIQLAPRVALFAAIASTVATATASAGTPVRDNNFEYAVTDVRNLGPRIDTGRAWRKADGTFEMVTVTITNISSEWQMYLGPKQLIDTQGRGFDEDEFTTFDLRSADERLPPLGLDPGKSFTFHVAFDIPTDAEPAYVVMGAPRHATGVKVPV